VSSTASASRNPSERDCPNVEIPRVTTRKTIVENLGFLTRFKKYVQDMTAFSTGTHREIVVAGASRD
jgi:hypothetical protein